MNNDINNQILFLKNKIMELENRLKKFEQSSTIPLEVDNAFCGRGFVKTYKPEIPDPAGDYTTNEGFRQTISLTGNAQDIVVPQFPHKFLEINDGSGLYIPLHAYFEFF